MPTKNTLDDKVHDATVVYITDPVTPEAVGKCTAAQYRTLYGLKGYDITELEDYEAHQTRLELERAGFAASGPPDDGDAIEIINAEKAAAAAEKKGA